MCRIMDNYIASALRYDDPNRYRRCGDSGILLPKVSLGLWKNFGHAASFADNKALMHYAFDEGITHFDLANNYGPPPGAAEEFFGEMIKTSFAHYRDELFVSTKAGYEMWPGLYGNWGSRKSLMASLDQSLRRMKLDYVDLFYIHRYDPRTPLDETLRTLVDIVRSGKALYVGISRWPLEATQYGFEYLRAHEVPCLCYQGRLNLLDRAVQQEGIMKAVVEEKTGFVSFSPLAQGLLTDKYLNGIPDNSRMRKEASLDASVLTPKLLQQLGALNELAKERGESLAQMALSWVLQQQGVTSVIVGAGSKAQLKDSLQCIYRPEITAEECSRIAHILK